jgi:cytidylate kinase
MRQRPPIIALAGPDGVGKSTLAKAIHTVASATVVSGGVVSFAAPIHELASGLSPHEKSDPRGREWMRRCGRSLRSIFGPDVLIDAVKSRMQRYAHLHIIDDLRTNDEACWVHAQRGIVVVVSRDGVAYTGGDLDSPIDARLVDASVPLLDATETARHILRLTGWLG